jgi:protein O-GlcNAc transferase
VLLFPAAITERQILSPSSGSNHTSHQTHLHAVALKMLIRRLVYIGVFASLLTLSVLGLFFFDIDLPTELQAFKIATLRKLNSVTGLKTVDSEFHISPVGEPIVYEDDIEELALEGMSLSTLPPPPPLHDIAADSSSKHEGDDTVSSYDTDAMKGDHGSPNSGNSDNTYPGSSLTLTSSFQTTVPNGAIIQGFSIFDNLVVHNGTFYIVTNNRSAFPEKAEDIYSISDDDDHTLPEPHAKVRT